MAAQLVTDQIRKAVRIRGSLGANTHNSGGGRARHMGRLPPWAPWTPGSTRWWRLSTACLWLTARQGGSLARAERCALCECVCMWLAGWLRLAAHPWQGWGGALCVCMCLAGWPWLMAHNWRGRSVRCARARTHRQNP